MDDKQENMELKEIDEKRSNSCVIDASVDDTGQDETNNDNNNNNKHGILNIGEEESNTLNKSFDEKLNFFKRSTHKDDVENLLDLSEDEDPKNPRKQRSNTIFAPTNRIIEKLTPKHKPLITNEYMSPLKLNTNTKNDNYSNQINKIDCKSMDDKADNDLFEYEESDDEKEDIIIKANNIIFFRNKMIEFKNNYDFKPRNEYENILNIENIFIIQKKEKNTNKDILILKHISKKRAKRKNNFWHKHIQKQNRKFSLSANLNLNSLLFTKDKDILLNKAIHKRSGTIHVTHNDGLFILSVLESAAKDKKKRKSNINI